MEEKERRIITLSDGTKVTLVILQNGKIYCPDMPTVKHKPETRQK